MFKEEVVRIFCVVCPCLFTLLLNCSAYYLGKDQERQIRRRCMVYCFHSGVEKFRRTLGAKIRNRNRWTNVTCLQLQIRSVNAVQDGCSLTITRINALKYNDIKFIIKSSHVLLKWILNLRTSVIVLQSRNEYRINIVKDDTLTRHHDH